MIRSPRLDELERRVRKDPTSISFAALAEEYRRAGLYQESVATCRVGLERHPTYVSARVTLARALIELQRFGEARAELERVLQAAPENLVARRALVEIASRLPPAVDENEIAHFHTTADAPALAGLEEFLSAIRRARRGIDGPSADDRR